MGLLTRENYQRGFLIDEELMGGVSTTGAAHLAFVLRHTTGEYLGTREFDDLDAALATINGVERPWKFESSLECGGGACTEGACGTGSCKKVLARLNQDCCEA